MIDCIAAMPAGGGMRPSADMTDVEKAKNSPAISPAPRAARNAAAVMRRSMLTFEGAFQASRTRSCQDIPNLSLTQPNFRLKG